jgi:hypothetical protein
MTTAPERGAVSLVDELKRPSTRDGSISARHLMPPPSNGSHSSSSSSPAELSLTTASPASSSTGGSNGRESNGNGTGNGSPTNGHPLFTYSGTPLHSFYVNSW